MLNSNDGGCALYPEEVDALLMPLLMAVYTQLSIVETAYILRSRLTYATLAQWTGGCPRENSTHNCST